MKNFLKKAQPYLIANAIIFALFTILYALYGVFPFGEKTLAHYDELSQIIPESAYVLDFLEGKSPLFFTTAHGLGSNTFGSLVYFIISPFNILLLAFGRSGMIYGYNLLFVLKLMLIVSVAIWFAKKHFKDFGTIKLLIVSLSYALCGFMFMMYTYFAFIDYLIAMPLLVEGFLYLKNKKKILPLTLVLLFMMLNCFGIGCFVMLYLFVLYGIYAYACLEREERKVVTVKTMCALLCAVGLAMPVLLPAFISFMGASRNVGWKNFFNLQACAVPSKIITHITEFIPFLFSIAYFFRCDKKDKFNQFLLVCEILTLILVALELPLKAFNMGSIYGYYSRFGFVGAFLTFFLACKYIDNYLKFEEKGPKFTYLYVIVGLGGIFYLFISIMLSINVSGTLASQTCTWAILAVYLLNLAMLSVPFIISSRCKEKIKGNFVIISFILVLISICGNCFYYLPGGTVDTKGSASLASFSQYIDAYDRVKVRDEGYLAMGTDNSGYSSCNIFSSLAEKETIQTLKFLGYDSTSNSSRSYSGTLLSDLIVGTKYYIYPYERNESYLKFIAHEGDYYLYQNLLSTDLIQVLSKEVTFADNVFKNQQLIFEAFGGEGKVLDEVAVDLIYEDCENKDGEIVVKPSKCGKIKIDYEVPTGKLLYAYNRDTKNYYKMGIDGCSFDYDTFVEMNRTGKNSKGEDNEMVIDVYENVSASAIKFYLMDIQKISELFPNDSNLRQEYNKFLGNIRLKTASTVVLPYANLKGYSVEVNGEKIEFSNKFHNFLTLDLEAGENVIEVTFTNPLYKYVLIGLIVAVVFVAIGILFNHFASKISSKLVDVLLFSLTIIITLVFIVVPSYANCYSLFKKWLS